MFDVTVKRARPLPILGSAAIMCCLLALLWFYAGSAAASNTRHQKELLTKAVDRTITECYALEGTYPPSIGYLEDHYGLTYDHERFYVDYQYVGGNLTPSATILERK